MTDITLVRHGETDWNKKRIIQGRFDIPLNETGMEQAIRTAKNFSKDSFDHIFCTPLIRTKQTALIIAKNIHFSDPVKIVDELIERDFGQADGKNIDEYYPRVLRGEIPDMETHEAIEHRVITALKTLAKTHPEQKLLVVCHSHVIKAALVALDAKKYSYSTHLQNGSITNLVFNQEEDRFTLDRVNYNDHL